MQAEAGVETRTVAGEKKERYVYMDGLRGVAAVGVLISHLFNHFFQAMHNPGPDDPVSRFFASLPTNAFYNGQFSVYVFFVLSGFVLSASVSHSRLGLPATIVRRYLRLTLPIMGVTLLFLIAARAGLFFNGLVTESAPHAGEMYPLDYKPGVGEWIMQVLFGIYWNGDYLLDGVVWTMKVEIWGSLFVYLIWRILPKKPVRMAACVVAFAVFVFAIDKHTSLQGLYLFPVGILLYDLSHGEGWRLLGKSWSMKVGIPVLVIGILCAAWRIKDPSVPGINLFIEGVLEPIFGNISRYQSQQAGAILIVAAVAMTTGLHQPLSNRFMRYLGAISFPLYLVHLLVIVSVGCLLFAWSYDHFGLEAARWITIPVTFVFTMGVATLLTALVEKPSIALAKLAGDKVEQFLKSVGWPPLRARPAAR